MKGKIKFSHLLKYLLVALPLMMFSCQEDNVEPPAALNEQSVEDFVSQLNPITSQQLPDKVQEQLDLTRVNLAKHMQGKLQITDVKVLGSISDDKSADMSHRVVADEDNVAAYGNIMEPSSVHIGKMKSLYSGKKLTDTRANVQDIAAQEIKSGDMVLEVTWKSGNETFTTQCFYRESGIVYDNVLTGLVMMDPEGHVEQSKTGKADRQAATYSSWYKQWWTAKWLWGSDRGEMGYKITIYYSGSYVSNTDVSDWGHITLGKARSESRIVKNSGSYGKCQYALGMCTPVGSLSFSHSNFSVSFSGLGSNVVANGYKSRYP
ncbi:hypothetical protein C900_02980 [Fulvivirga imtechensis AK7]|uniref:DUF4848 domain-containing protein n=1 Tax=Fulvivirga imtechensis AK7 TaxID=1237149 RepID=L8JQE3_9BACT|nr:hypothetical protein [Fulvivirga imtechensis]ELR71176.1 hypothetical protein C900_02980 [Fulvivirga imtechensis AK7]